MKSRWAAALLVTACLLVSGVATLVAPTRAAAEAVEGAVEPSPEPAAPPSPKPSLFVPEESFIFVLRDGRLEVLQQVLLVNTGEGAEPTPTIAILEGGRDVRGIVAPAGTPSRPPEEFEPRETAVIDAGHVRDTQALPGLTARRYQVTYWLPWTGSASIRRPVLYPTQSIFLSARSGELAVSAPGLTDEGVRELAGVPLHIYRLGPASKGMIAGARIAPEGRSGTAGFWTGVGLFLVAFAGLTVRRLRSLNRAMLPSGERARTEALIRAIASLDVRFERGEISREVWEREREVLKNSLRPGGGGAMS